MPIAACAQSVERVPLSRFGADPARFVNHRIRIDRVGCFFYPEAGLECTTYRGLYVVPGEVVPGVMKAAIEGECGGIVETEDDPNCLFDITFTPVGVTRGVGTVTKGDKSVEGSIWKVQTSSVSVAPHR
jgi:hypothetical protein